MEDYQMAKMIRNTKDIEKVMKQQIQKMMATQKQQIEQYVYDYIDSQNFENMISGYNMEDLFNTFNGFINVETRSISGGMEMYVEIIDKQINDENALIEEIKEKFLQDIPEIFKKNGLNVVRK